jgi:hypothetical protein
VKIRALEFQTLKHSHAPSFNEDCCFISANFALKVTFFTGENPGFGISNFETFTRTDPLIDISFHGFIIYPFGANVNYSQEKSE